MMDRDERGVYCENLANCLAYITDDGIDIAYRRRSVSGAKQ